MRRAMKHALLFAAAIALVVSLVGCFSFPGFIITQKRSAPVHLKGELVVVQGTVVVRGNQIYLDEQGGDGVFKFVGMKKDDAASFSRLAGRVVRVRLKIISVESAKSINAQLVDILQ
jgi:hypothetical protein